MVAVKALRRWLVVAALLRCLSGEAKTVYIELGLLWLTDI